MNLPLYSDRYFLWLESITLSSSILSYGSNLLRIDYMDEISVDPFPLFELKNRYRQFYLKELYDHTYKRLLNLPSKNRMPNSKISMAVEQLSDILLFYDYRLNQIDEERVFEVVKQGNKIFIMVSLLMFPEDVEIMQSFLNSDLNGYLEGGEHDGAGQNNIDEFILFLSEHIKSSGNELSYMIERSKSPNYLRFSYILLFPALSDL